MIALVARYLVRRGMEAEVQELLRGLAPLVRAEAGCAAFLVHVSPDDPRRVFLYEQYLDERALAAHRETAHFKAVIEGEVVPRIETREREIYTVLA